MRLHANARLGPRGRAVMVARVLEGWPVRDAATSAGVSAQTCRKWIARYRSEGGDVGVALHVAHRIPGTVRRVPKRRGRRSGQRAGPGIETIS